MSEPSYGADDVATTQEIGAAATMRRAREAAGLSLAEVAERTRVPLRHLAALEQGDYGSLPGTTYCAGFSRAYARAVGLDEGALVSEVRREIGEMGGLIQDPYDFKEAVNPSRLPPRWLAWTAAVIALLLATGYGIWRMQINTPPTDQQIEAQRAQETPAPSAANRSPETVGSAILPGPVVLTAADDVWMRIYEPDGTRLFEGTLARGQSYTVPGEARAPLILTGRPDALAVTVGGQAVPPLGTAERTISDVSISATALVARLGSQAGSNSASSAPPPKTGSLMGVEPSASVPRAALPPSPPAANAASR